MGSLPVRLLFVVYALTLGFLAVGRFDPSTAARLQTIGLRSAVGVLGWLLAGLVAAYVLLWRRRRVLQEEAEYADRLPRDHRGIVGIKIIDDEINRLRPEQDIRPEMDDTQRPYV